MNQRRGWSWGTTGTGKEWLTILGSHWAAPPLVERREDAIKNAAYHQPWFADQGVTLALVVEVYHPGVESGRAYRIEEIAEPQKMRHDGGGPGCSEFCSTFHDHWDDPPADTPEVCPRCGGNGAGCARMASGCVENEMRLDPWNQGDVNAGYHPDEVHA